LNLREVLGILNVHSYAMKIMIIIATLLDDHGV